MTDVMMQSTENDLSEMLGAYLRRRTASAKDLAQRANLDPRTADGFRAGRHWPQAKHWPGLVLAFGKDITDCIFHPDEAYLRLTQEEAALEAQLADIQARIGVVAKGGRGHQRRRTGLRPASENRAFHPPT